MADEHASPDPMYDPTHTWAFILRCTMEARRVIAHAYTAVHELGGPAIAPEHLLLGLLKPDVRASKHLTGPRFSSEEFRRRVVGLLDGATPSESIDVPITDAAKKVMATAWSEAESRGHQKIQSAHLLIGLLATPGSPVAQLLLEKGLTADHVAVGLPGTDPDLEDA